jgi:single-strand DNA-binding protein
MGKKGTKVYVEGKLTTREWTTDSGEKRYVSEVVIDISGTFQVLSRKADDSGAAPRQYEKPTQNEGASSAKKETKKENILPAQQVNEEPPVSDYTDDVNDDDIPF